jgi:acetylornithine deacetylase/succinyl-diaminopimelate desuccinylase-like protein
MALDAATSTDARSRPDRVAVQRVSLNAKQKALIEAAWAFISPKEALDLDVTLTNIWSHTGFEREFSEFATAHMKAAGLDAFYQGIDPRSGNAIARITGDNTGPTLMLVAPCDSHFTGRQEDDGVQWGDPMRRDNTLPAQVEDQTIIGLSSENPKALCAAIMLATEALAKAGVSFKGSLIAGLAAGGAPARSAPSEERKNISLGAGVRHMVAHGLVGDFAIYHKPGYHVSWEEVGLNQFRVRVKGDPTYMARPPYDVVTNAAKIAIAFNEWAKAEYPKREIGLFRPGASMNVIQVGRPDKPNWSAAVAELYADVRSQPGEPAIKARYIFDEAMERICATLPGVDAEWEMVASMPGGRTDPNSWIVQSSIRGVQAVEGEEADLYVGRTAGQTEMGYLQSLGIECAAVRGLPDGGPAKPIPADLERGFSLSGAYAPNIVKAAKVMVYAAVDTLTRSRAEVGLDY